MTITITPAPVVDAGIDQTVCAATPAVSLNGSVTVGSTTGQWSSSGTGTFSPDDITLNATYNPSAADIAAGTVTLTLTATNACAPINDNFIVTIIPLPVVYAGLDQTICESILNITLNGSITIGGSVGIWSSNGSGTFGDPNALSTTYTPSATDISAGTVTITLTSTDGCFNVSDSMTLTIHTMAIVSAGADQTLCSNNSVTTLSGTISGYTTTGIWTTSGSGTFTSTTNLNTLYIPSSADTTAGSVTITLTSTNNGSCAAVADNLVITLTTAPYVDAGADIFVCANNPDVNLNGIVAGASYTGIWESSGTGTFSPDNTTLNATYTPSDADTATGVVVLVLTSADIGTCLPVSDTLIVNISPGPVAIAGLDIYICKDDSAQLNGQILYGTSTGTWTSNGTGTFIPNADDLNAIYVPSGADTLAGVLQLTLTSTNNGGCFAASDVLTLTFTERPDVEAGIDQVICANNSADLTGSVSGSSTTGLWTTSGTGSFLPSDTSLVTTYYPSVADATAGNVTITLASTYACSSSDFLIITLDPPPVVVAGTDFIICETQNSVNLSGSVTGATTTGIWTTSGTGTFIPDNTTLNAVYNLSLADISTGNISLILTSTNNGDCNVESDTVSIILDRLAIVDAGMDITTCDNNLIVNLTGNISGGTTTGIWTTTGTGTFDPSDTDLNATYNPTFADTVAGSIVITLTSTNNGACSDISDDLTVIFNPSPWVFAGTDITVCANNASVSLNGSIAGGASEGIWTTTGTGLFVPANTDLNATYIPSVNDTVNGSVILILTSTDNGNCLAVNDSMTVIISDAPSADAGTDQIICSGEDALLYGYINSVASGGIWTTLGDGAFLPSNTDLITTYIPGVGDTTNHSVTIYLTTTGIGDCITVIDSLIISISPRPLVDAGFDQTICSNSTATLSGSVSGSSTTGFWSTSGSGIFSPDINDFSATYIPSNSDTTNGSVILVLTSTNACLSQDSMILTLTPAPFVDAGTDEIICASDNQVLLNGNVFGATSTGIWTTSGTGTFNPDSSDLNATYIISTEDSLAGYVELILTSTNNGTCFAESDTLSITITDIPAVDAGIDQIICANNTVLLFGSITGIVTTGEWASLGSGSFLPSSNALNATYIPSDADTTAGTVDLVLSSVGSCEIISDTVTITITPAPWVNAGLDVTVCANDANVILSGNIWGATTTGLWSTSGTGSFIPTNSDLNGTYIPSATDTATGFVTIILEASNIGSCTQVNDTLLVTITDVPIVNGGIDQVICIGDQVNLLGSIVSVSGEGIWISDGDGSFSPVNTDLSATYIPGSNDELTGYVTLYLTSTNIGNCIAVTDTVFIEIVPKPVIDAGIDQIICSNTSVMLSGSVTGSSTTGYWTTNGSGLFLPDSTDFNATYYPSDADTSAGLVTICLISTSSCYALDSMVLTLTDAPFVDAGIDQIICATDQQVFLDGNIYGATSTGVWTTLGSGIFLPGPTSLNATYYISTADSAAGYVDLVLMSSNNGSCLTESDTMRITITDIPLVDAGIDQTVCANNDILLTGNIIGIVTTGAWTSLGTGNFIPDSTDMNATYILSPVDTANGYVNLVLQSVGSCQIIYDTMTISLTPAPWVYAGPNISVCANNPNVPLSGSVWGATTTGQWSTNGTGMFSPSLTDLNATYIPSNADTAAGSVIITLTATDIGLCNPESDALVITFTAPPVADAGSDIIACNDGNVFLDGIVYNGNGTGIWSSTGSGTFTPSDSTLNATYIPGVADTVIGSVQMILTTTNNGGCFADNDTLNVTFTPRPYVYAGDDFSMCSSDTVFLSGIISGSSTTGFWISTGNGSFLPDSTDLNAEYILSQNDLDSGYVVIVLTSSNACSSTDTLVINIIPVPVANAGPNQVICPGIMMVNLNGNVTGVDTAGVWTTTGSGTFIPDSTTLNATYIMSAADTSAGSVVLILTSIGSGFCSSSSDSMTVTISSGPIIDAGPDLVACANATVSLSAISSSSTNYWTSTGSGSFSPDSTDLNANYIFSTADTVSGFVILVLNSSNSCGFSDDSIYVTITPAPYVEAGPDYAVCSNYPDVPLAGIVSAGATTGIWTTSGSGVFIPSDTDLNATYIPDTTDTVAGTVIIYLTSTNNGDCNPIVDSLVVTINPTPILYAGDDQTICNSSIVHLEGTISSIAGTGYWSTSGDGAFSPDNYSLTGDYSGGTNDLLNGQVELILEATNLGNCITEPDTMIAIFISANSGAELGNDTSICNGDSLLLLPEIQGDTGTVHWMTSGGGIFLPGDSLLTVTYVPGVNDVDSGQVWIYIQYTFTCGTVYDSLLLSVNAVPDAGFVTSWDCKNNIITFSDTSTVYGGNITIWEWDLGDGNINSVQTFDHEYNNIGSYNITIIVHSDSGCVDTAIGSVFVWEPVIAMFTASDTSIFPGEEIVFTDESSGQVTWYWDFGDDVGTSNLQNPIYSYSIFSDYIVWLYIEGENGCLDSAYQTIHILDNGFGIPSGFTPNKDNLNDEFYVRGGPFTTYELRIFNSWGQQVFISTDQDIGWDGTFKGKEQPEGVYIYVFNGEKFDGSRIEQTGDITLIR
ncbi:MAG: PKD domain-containing protein [Bacteroidota bacterium]